MNGSQDQLKKIAGSLLENDMFLHGLVENTSVFVMRVNKDGKILYYNGSNLFGYESKDVIGKSLGQMSEIETVEHYLENAAHVMESGEPVIYEDHVEWQDREYDFQIYIYPLLDEANRIDSVGTIAFNLTEQRRIEKALHESEQRFKTVFESAKDLIFIKDKSFRYTHVSPSMAKLFGMELSDLIGKTDNEIFGSEDAKEIRQVDKRVLQGETIEREDKMHVHGVRKTFHVIKTPMYANSGEINSLCGIARDITERINSENELRKSQERYELATSAARMGVWDWDLLTNEVYIDPKIKALLGYSDEEIPNELDEITKHAHPDHKEQIWKDAISYFSGAETNFETEYRMIHKDGTTRWIMVIGTAIRNDNGKPLRMIGTLTDVTERKRIEEALKISEQKYRKLYNDAPVGYHEIDTQGKIMNMNQTEAEMLGYNVEEMIGKYIWEFAAPAQKKLVRESIQQKIRNREEDKSFERTYLC
ncbi:PAS domain S-box protein, partial [candidate division KSB1 bacterium]|nr:PAS domain S-box protein [candidate division KSB1 bacterium]